MICHCHVRNNFFLAHKKGTTLETSKRRHGSETKPKKTTINKGGASSCFSCMAQLSLCQQLVWQPNCQKSLTCLPCGKFGILNQRGKVVLHLARWSAHSALPAVVSHVQHNLESVTFAMQGNIIAECRLACKDVDVDVSVCKSPWQETLDAMPDICSRLFQGAGRLALRSHWFCHCWDVPGSWGFKG